MVLSVTSTSHFTSALPIPERHNVPKWKQVTYHPDQPLLQTWEIVICTVTVVGLFVLLGIYYKRKASSEIAYNAHLLIDKILLVQEMEQRWVGEKERILKDNPDWKPVVEAWRNISLENAVWLLKVLELRKFGVHLPTLDFLTSTLPVMSELSQILSLKNKIEKDLQSITHLHLCGKELENCPDSIGLLPNLEELDLSFNRISEPPNLSKNKKLKRLYLSCNKFTKAPVLTQNLNLQVFNIEYNELREAPNLKQNKKLEALILKGNQLSSLPDLTELTSLEVLDFKRNQVTNIPDLSKNVNLIDIDCGYNQFSEELNLHHNVKLKSISFENIGKKPNVKLPKGFKGNLTL